MVNCEKCVWDRFAFSRSVSVLLAFVTMLAASVSASALADEASASEQCNFSNNEIKVSVTVGQPQARVGDVLWVEYTVSGAKLSAKQLSIAIEFPAESRFEGSGFLATVPGTKGPLGITLGADVTSAIVPFSWEKASVSGRVGWRPLQAGLKQLRWRLVATGRCSPQDILTGVLPEIVVWPGDAKIVQHDVFGQDTPVRKVRNPQGTRDIVVYKDHYRIATAGSGQILFEGPGANPSFTTSGRFVTSSRFSVEQSSDPSQSLDDERQIVDAVNGKVIWSGSARYIAFAENDSLVVLGNAVWEKFFLMSTLIDPDKANLESISFRDYSGKFIQGMRMIIACSNYDNKIDDRDRVFALDFNTGVATFSLTSPDDALVSDRNSERLFGISLLSTGVDMWRDGKLGNVKERNSILSRGTVSKLTKTANDTFDGIDGASPTASLSTPGWKIGQSVVLEQDLWNVDGKRRPEVGTVLPPDSVTDGLGALNVSGRDSRDDDADAAQAFDTLESVGLRFSTSVQVMQFRMRPITDGSEKAKSAGKAARAAILSKQFGLTAKEIKALFQTNTAATDFYCNTDQYGNESGLPMGLGHLDLAAKFAVTSREYDLLEFSCFTGSGWAAGGRVLLRKLLLLDRIHGKLHLRDLEAVLGRDSPVFSGAQRDAASNKFSIYGVGRNTIALISAGGVEPVLLDLERFKVIRSKISLAHPELLQSVKLSDDEKTLIQYNRDGAVYVHDIEAGDTLFNGSVVDGEAVVATSDGYFDSTYEGAYNVRVRFDGLAEDYSFEQFAGVLRIHDLVRLVLSRKGGLPHPTVMSPPLVAASVVENTGSDPLHPRSVKIHAAIRSEAAQLKTLDIFVDGRFVRSEPLDSSAIERDFVVDANAGSTVTIVASDRRGLRSLAASLQAPGEWLPTGTLRVLSVGVDLYDDLRLPRLHSAAGDAQKMAQVLSEERGKRFAGVEVRMLQNGKATQEAILGALESMIEMATGDDAIILFFASHGLEPRSEIGGNKPGDLYIALEGTVLDRAPDTALSWNRIAQALSPSKVPIIVFLDACHGGFAGEVVDTANDFAAARLMTVPGAPIAIFAASKRRQVSRASEGEGLFTRAIVDNLQSRPANSVSVSSLYRSVRAEVDRQTDGRQTPWLARNEVIGDLRLF